MGKQFRLDFAITTMLASVIFGSVSLAVGSEAGLGFAGGLTVAAGTAFQVQREKD